MRILLTLFVSFLFLESAHAVNDELMAEARHIVHIRAQENLKKYEDDNGDMPEKKQKAREQFNTFFEESNIPALNSFIVLYLEMDIDPIFGEFNNPFKGIKDALMKRDITVEKLFQNSQNGLGNEKEEEEYDFSR